MIKGARRTLDPWRIRRGMAEYGDWTQKGSNKRCLLFYHFFKVYLKAGTRNRVSQLIIYRYILRSWWNLWNFSLLIFISMGIFFLHFLRSTLFLFSINYYLKTCTFGICTKQWYKQYHCRLLENRSFRSFRSFRNIFRNIFAFLLWRKTSIAWFP